MLETFEKLCIIKIQNIIIKKSEIPQDASNVFNISYHILKISYSLMFDNPPITVQISVQIPDHYI